MSNFDGSHVSKDKLCMTSIKKRKWSIKAERTEIIGCNEGAPQITPAYVERPTPTEEFHSAGKPPQMTIDNKVPRTRPTMAKDNREIEVRVMKAFDKVQTETRPNLAKIAREFDVPYNRLRLRVQGKKSLFGRPANGRKLDLAQEKALGDWLEYNDNLGLSVKHNDIIAAASSIMRLSNPSGSLSSGPLLSERWMQRWLQRYPEYRTQNRKAPSADRLRAHDKSTIESWFQRFKDFIEKYDIQHEDFYNYGETRFQLGASEDQWIITREPHNKFASGIHEKGEYVTVLEAISADGFVVPPLVILAAEQVQPPSIWSEEPGNERIHVTDTGCITETLALKWMQDFEESTRLRTKGAWRMLLCDGLTSHVNLEMVKYCEDRKIKLFFIPPHTSSILQPLDVGVSNAHENRQSEAIEAATATGSIKLTIVDFLTGIESIQSKSFTKNTARLGFERSGYWPFNPAIVCDKLVEYTPPVRPPPPTNTINPTPLNASTITIQRFQKIENRLLSRLSEYDNLVKKLTQGAHDCVCQLQEVQREIEAMKAVALAHRTT